MLYQLNKVISKKGANKIYDFPNEITLIDDYFELVENIEGLSNTIYLSTYFSYSFNNKDWSLWIPYSPTNFQQHIQIEKPFRLKIKWEITENLTNDSVTILSVGVKYNSKEKNYFEVDDKNFSDLSSMEIGDFHIAGASIANVHADIDFWINKNQGIVVRYWLTKPDINTSDYFLNEYSLHNTVDEKCINVIIPDGVIPENKPEINEWGTEFEEFEIEIDKRYFESIFGINEKPRNGDYMYFPVANKMFYIFSNYLKRGIHETATSYRLNLKTYEDDLSVSKDEETIEFIGNMKNHEELFAEEIVEEFVDNEKIQQNIPKTLSQDNVREEINSENIIVNDIVYNNGTELMKNYYDFRKIPTDEIAIKYEQEIFLNENSSIGFSNWIKIEKENLSEKLSFNIITQELIGYNQLKLVLNKDVDVLELFEGALISGVNCFLIKEILKNNTIIVSHNSILAHVNLINLKKSSVINLCYTTGDNSIRIDIVDYKNIVLHNNSGKIEMPISELSGDKWYNITTNISNPHKFLGFYIWSIEGNGERNGTNLVNEFKKEIPIPNCYIIEKSKPFILGSSAYFGNIRIFNRSLEFQYQSQINSVRVLPKPSVAFIIDDAQTIFNNRNVGSSKLIKTDPYGNEGTKGSEI